MRTAFIAAFAMLLVMALLSGCANWAPGRQAYWDEQVKEMCRKDGGITVYETVELTEEQYKRLGGAYGGLPIPNIDVRDQPRFPFFRERSETRINQSNPEVVRSEEVIKRRSDETILARSVMYWRRGGGIPTGLAHESYFMCPEQADMSKQVFKIRGAGTD